MKKYLKVISVFNCSYISMLIFAYCLQYIYGEQLFTFVCDAQDYFYRGQAIYDTSFDISSIDGFRGVVFPFILACVHALGGKSFFYLFSPLVFCFFTIICLPLLFSKDILLNFWSWKKLFLFNGIVAVLFIGLWLFPLSDFWAMFFLSVSLLISKILLYNNRNIMFFLCPLFSGIFLYFAYNIRTIYLYVVLACICIYIYIYIKYFGLKSVFMIFAMIIGLCFASIPQMINNKTHTNEYSPFVPTQGLMLSQLLWGIQYQRYDTFFASKKGAQKALEHTSPQVFFIDKKGQELLKNEGINSFNKFSNYFEFVVKYPVDVFIIYINHFFNYLFPCWPTLYVDDLYSNKLLWGIPPVLMLFLMIFATFNNCIISKDVIFLTLPILIVGLAIVPGCVEYRFSFPIYLFVLGNLFFNVDLKKGWNIFRQNMGYNVIVFLILLILCYTVWSNMLISESVTPLMLIN